MPAFRRWAVSASTLTVTTRDAPLADITTPLTVPPRSTFTSSTRRGSVFTYTISDTGSGVPALNSASFWASWASARFSSASSTAPCWTEVSLALASLACLSWAFACRSWFFAASTCFLAWSTAWVSRSSGSGASYPASS